jgi:hypothetical protein
MGGNMKRSAILLGIVILFSACATSSSAPKPVYVIHADDLADNPSAQLDQDTVVCENVLVVGSHFPQRICQTVRDREENRQQTQNHLSGKVPSFQRGGN